MTIQLYELAGKDDRRFSPYCWRARWRSNTKVSTTKPYP